MKDNESTLKKEFSKRDVQRMRNLISGKSGERTTVLSGWEQKTEDHKEGDTWQDALGKTWTIKNGIKQSVTKMDKFKHLNTMPIACPVCNKHMRADDVNKKMYAIHNRCLDCVVEMEAKIKLEGKWEEYSKNIMNANKNAGLEDFEKAVEAWMQERDTFVSENGEVESWQGGDKKKMFGEIMEKLAELKKTDIY